MEHKVEKIILKNGGDGLLIDVPGATTFSTQFVFRAGFDYAERRIYEVPHILEHVMHDGNRDFADKMEFERVYRQNGAYRNAYTNDWYVAYLSRCADFEWERIFYLQTMMIANPSLSMKDFRSETGNIRSEMTGLQNNYGWLLENAITRARGGDLPSLDEEVKLIDNVKLTDIKAYYQKTHTWDNLRLIISGDLKNKRATILERLQNMELPRGEFFELIDQKLHGCEPVLVKRKDAKNLRFSLEWDVGRLFSDQEMAGMGLLNNILTETMASRIFGVARDRGLVYGMGSGLSRGAYETSWGMAGEVNYENASALMELVATELQRVVEGDISEEEIEVSKGYKIGKFQMRELTAGLVSEQYAFDYLVSGKITDIEAYPKDVKKATRKQIIKLAKEFLTSKNVAFGCVGNVNQEYINNLWEILCR